MHVSCWANHSHEALGLAENTSSKRDLDDTCTVQADRPTHGSLKGPKRPVDVGVPGMLRRWRALYVSARGRDERQFSLLQLDEFCALCEVCLDTLRSNRVGGGEWGRSAAKQLRGYPAGSWQESSSMHSNGQNVFVAECEWEELMQREIVRGKAAASQPSRLPRF